MPLFRLRERQKNRTLINTHGQTVDLVAGDVIELSDHQAASLVNIVQRLPDPEAMTPKAARDGRPLAQQPPEGAVPNQIAIAPGETKGTGPDKAAADPVAAAAVTHKAEEGQPAKPLTGAAPVPASAAKTAPVASPAARATTVPAAVKAEPVKPAAPTTTVPVAPADAVKADSSLGSNPIVHVEDNVPKTVESK